LPTRKGRCSPTVSSTQGTSSSTTRPPSRSSPPTAAPCRSPSTVRSSPGNRTASAGSGSSANAPRVRPWTPETETPETGTPETGLPGRGPGLLGQAEVRDGVGVAVGEALLGDAARRAALQDRRDRHDLRARLAQRLHRGQHGAARGGGVLHGQDPAPRDVRSLDAPLEP